MTFLVITTHSYHTICYHTLFLQEPALLLSEHESQTVILRELGTSKSWISWLCREMCANGWIEVKAKLIKTSTNSPMEQTTTGSSDLHLVTSGMSGSKCRQHLIKDQLLGVLLISIIQGVMLPSIMRASPLQIWDSMTPCPHTPQTDCSAHFMIYKRCEPFLDFFQISKLFFFPSSNLQSGIPLLLLEEFLVTHMWIGSFLSPQLKARVLNI